MIKNLERILQQNIVLTWSWSWFIKRDIMALYMGWTYGLKSKPDPYTTIPFQLLGISLKLFFSPNMIYKHIPQCLAAQHGQVLHIPSRPLQWLCNIAHQQLIEQEQKEPANRKRNTIKHGHCHMSYIDINIFNRQI